MSIRIIQKGIVKCDFCQKELAKIRASKQIFQVLIDEEKFNKIICMTCFEDEETKKKIDPDMF